MPDHHYNLGLLLRDVVAAHAGQPALRFAEHTYSYADLSGWAERLGALLLAGGCRQGDVIAIGHTKQPLSYALMLAALRLGVAYVNFDVSSPSARTSAILQVCGARLLFFDDQAHAAELESLAAANACRALRLGADALPEVSRTSDLSSNDARRRSTGRRSPTSCSRQARPAFPRGWPSPTRTSFTSSSGAASDSTSRVTTTSRT